MAWPVSFIAPLLAASACVCASPCFSTFSSSAICFHFSFCTSIARALCCFHPARTCFSWHVRAASAPVFAPNKRILCTLRSTLANCARLLVHRTLIPHSWLTPLFALFGSICRPPFFLL